MVRESPLPDKGATGDDHDRRQVPDVQQRDSGPGSPPATPAREPHAACGTASMVGVEGYDDGRLPVQGSKRRGILQATLQSWRGREPVLQAWP